MKILLRFSQEYIELTKKEFEQLMQCKLKNYKLKEIGKGYFIINTESPNSKEIIQKISQNSHYLALTKGIWEILFKSETNSEEKVIKETIHRKKTTAESNFRQTTKSLKSSKDHNIDKKIIDKLQKSNIKEELLYQIISKSRTISWNKIIRGKYAVRIKKIKQSSSNTIKKSIKKHNRNNSIEKENKNNRHQNIQPAKTFNANQFQIAFSDIIWTFLNESNNKHNKQLSQKRYDSKENNNTNATETRR
ncbi:MAG: hypothetical protein GWP09_02895, partial [Nitrospiraceae bacterium]|nr:hypothetical protein [Nitrospiraceae bacterium]